MLTAYDLKLNWLPETGSSFNYWQDTDICEISNNFLMFSRSPVPEDIIPTPPDINWHLKIKMAAKNRMELYLLTWMRCLWNFKLYFNVFELAIFILGCPLDYTMEFRSYLFSVNNYNYFRLTDDQFNSRGLVAVRRSRRSVLRHWNVRPRKHGNKLWSFVVISSQSMTIATSGLRTTILIFRSWQQSGDVDVVSFGTGDLENIGI
jgi:hypothetical protein